MWPLVTASCALGLLEPRPALDADQRVLDRRIRGDPPPGAGDPLHTTMVLRNSARILDGARRDVCASGPVRLFAVVRTAYMLGSLAPSV